MTDDRNHIYRGFEMISAVGGDLNGGFFVAMQWIRLTTQGARQNVNIDGVASGRFADLDSAFTASFSRMREAIDRHIDG